MVRTSPVATCSPAASTSSTAEAIWASWHARTMSATRTRIPSCWSAPPPPRTPGEQGYAVPNFETSWHSLREKAGDITSTNAMLWTVAAGAYFAQMGPRGMREIGKTLLANTHYAKQRLAAVKGIRLPCSHRLPSWSSSSALTTAGKQVEQVNKALLDHGIFGGHDISKEYPSLGQSAPDCFTEMISKQDIDHLAARSRRCSDDEQRLVPGPF